jgi:hypothetical protein
MANRTMPTFMRRRTRSGARNVYHAKMRQHAERH